MQLVFVCGGRGTRLTGRAAGVPKSMVELHGETLLGRLWRQLSPWHTSAAPPVIVAAQGDALVPAFAASHIQIARVVEQPAPDGVANAITLALPHLGGPALVVLGDVVLCGTLPLPAPEPPALVLWPAAPHAVISRNFGVQIDASGVPTAVLEKPVDPRGLVCGIGLYWLTREVIQRFCTAPINPATGEREITAALDFTMRETRYRCWDFSGRYFNVNTATELAEAEAERETGTVPGDP